MHYDVFQQWLSSEAAWSGPEVYYIHLVPSDQNHLDNGRGLEPSNDHPLLPKTLSSPEGCFMQPWPDLLTCMPVQITTRQVLHLPKVKQARMRSLTLLALTARIVQNLGFQEGR